MGRECLHDDDGKCVGSVRVTEDGVRRAGRRDDSAILLKSVKMQRQSLGGHGSCFLKCAPSRYAAGEVREAHTVVTVRILMNEADVLAFHSYPLRRELSPFAWRCFSGCFNWW